MSHLSLWGGYYFHLVWLQIWGMVEIFWLLGSPGALKCVQMGCIAICVNRALWSYAGHSSQRCPQHPLTWQTLLTWSSWPWEQCKCKGTLGFLLATPVRSHTKELWVHWIAATAFMVYQSETKEWQLGKGPTAPVLKKLCTCHHKRFKWLICHQQHLTLAADRKGDSMRGKDNITVFSVPVLSSPRYQPC